MSRWSIQKLRGLVGLGRAEDTGGVRVKLLIKGRIGPGWYDVDKDLRLPEGFTLGQLIERSPGMGLPLPEALEASPHLSETLMWNGERCPVDAHRDRAFQDGDTLYLLAPIAGG